MLSAVSNDIIIETATRFGTPVFLYHINCIEEKYHTLRKMLSEACDIFYSMKANPSLAICRFFCGLGSGCEVSSENELFIALKAGFSPEHIIFVGPVKKKSDLALAIRKKIRHVVVESIEEILLLNVLASDEKTPVSILIRVNPDFVVPGAPIKMSGVATQFGMDVQVLSENIGRILSCQYITISGIQVYNASRVLHHASIIKNIENILNLSKEIQLITKTKLTTIDFGGGFGVPYFEGEPSLNIAFISSEINKLIKNYKNDYPYVNFIIELGRYLVADSGYFISAVQSIKKSHGKNYILLDGGMNCYLGATGIGSFVHRNFPMRYVSLKARSYKELLNEYHVVGPLCTPGDILLKNIFLPEPLLDDLIVIEKTGAYGLTASPGKFISHGSPAEVAFSNGAFKLIRRKEALSDLLATQII